MVLNKLTEEFATYICINYRCHPSAHSLQEYTLKRLLQVNRDKNNSTSVYIHTLLYLTVRTKSFALIRVFAHLAIVSKFQLFFHGVIGYANNCFPVRSRLDRNNTTFPSARKFFVMFRFQLGHISSSKRVLMSVFSCKWI